MLFCVSFTTIRKPTTTAKKDADVRSPGHLWNADGQAVLPLAGPGRSSSEGTKQSQRTDLKILPGEDADSEPGGPEALVPTRRLTEARARR